MSCGIKVVLTEEKITANLSDKVGVMVADLGSLDITPSTQQQTFTPTDTDGWNEVSVAPINSELEPNLIPINIRAGVSVFGVQGNLEPDKPDQIKEVVPTDTDIIVVSDVGYELGEVIVKAIPDTYGKVTQTGNKLTIE